MSTLETLNMNFNSILGQIPKVIGKLIKLRVLKLGGNKLIGFIPLSLSNASRLETWEISYNSLQGNILEGIGNLHNMKVLSIQANQLTGCIPFTIFNISRIEIIPFTGNSLSGSLPSGLCNGLLILKGFYLSTNKLRGHMPTSLSSCSQLQILSLSENEFDGPIHSEIGRLSNLQILYLGTNHFTGIIPQEIGNLVNLMELWMEKNQITGSVPISIFNISSMQILSLWQNNLSGFLPWKIGNLTKMQHLQIGGEIPKEISNLIELEKLDLGFNSFSDRLNMEIFNISGLRIIDLTFNNLAGSDTSQMTALAFDDILQSHYVKNQALVEWRDHAWRDLGFELNPAGFELFTVVEFKVEETSKVKLEIGPSYQGKDEHTNELQGKIATSNTFVHVNDDPVANKPLSVSSSLPTCEYIDSFPFMDDEHVVRVDTLVDPLDDRVDSSCKVDLCPPSVEAIVLKGSTSSCENCVDQLVCKTFPPLEVMCDVINESQSEELTCSKSSHGLDNALFRYNVLFEDDISTPTMASGENYGIACLGGYSLYTNPLWCDNLPLKVENILWEDESTLKGKECVVLEANPSSTLCDFIVEYSWRWLGN
ncbi:putative LRR receptor-like serine/threonine-protein kinase-like [Capsicum annuum]|nr:putative LRR receptor-like serine/threonine-protein kinase-like [Capsicum annuum]